MLGLPKPVTTVGQEAIDMAYRNFVGTCKSPVTRYIYKKALQYFLSYLRLGSILRPIGKSGDHKQRPKPHK